VDAVAKHNERNPGKEVLYLNYAAVDPDLTNSKCSYWHFRLDADTSMKMEALTTFMKDQKDVKKVYLINQNYSHGQQVAKYAKETLKRKRPDVQIVGDDLHPLAQVRDFRALHRQDQGLGRRHRDHRQLGLRPVAADQGRQRGGYNGKFYTYYAGVTGTPDRLGTCRAAASTGGLCPLQHGWADEPDVVRTSRRSSTTTSTPAPSIPRLHHAVRSHGQGQVHRPGQGGGCAGRHEVQELQRRSRDAQDRPPAAAAVLYMTVGKGRRQVPHTLPRTPA
jgi:hypothetical protein